VDKCRAIAWNFIGGFNMGRVWTNEWPKATNVAKGHERIFGKIFEFFL